MPIRYSGTVVGKIVENLRRRYASLTVKHQNLHKFLKPEDSLSI